MNLPKRIPILLLLSLLALLPLAAAQGGEVIAGGLNGPMGVLVALDGSVWVVDSGTGGDQAVEILDPESGETITAQIGNTSRVLQIHADGSQTVAATLPSVLTGEEAGGGSRLARLGINLYVTSGGWEEANGPEPLPMMAVVARVKNGEATAVASTWSLERDENPDGFILDSHPYAITGGPDGNLYVGDAGGNALLRVNPRSGKVEVVAVFDGIPSPLPNPARNGRQESDPVPTGVVVDRDFNIYLSLLPGFPFLPGSAKVVKVSPDGSVSDFATGLTFLTDLRQGPDGKLYAVQMAVFGEQGPTPNSGALVRIDRDGNSEVVLDGLSFPTSVDFNPAGDAYLTINGVGAPGSGQLVRFNGVAR